MRDHHTPSRVENLPAHVADAEARSMASRKTRAIDCPVCGAILQDGVLDTEPHRAGCRLDGATLEQVQAAASVWARAERIAPMHVTAPGEHGRPVHKSTWRTWNQAMDAQRDLLDLHPRAESLLVADGPVVTLLWF